MIEPFTSELTALTNEGGWVLWCLIALAFGITFSLISIWQSLREISDPTTPDQFARPRRRIAFAFVLISTAPLIGLLGTVSGMFTTFDGLAGVAASAAPVDVISRGVSEAMITTQAGLIIGIPAFIICTLLKSRFNRLQFGFQLHEAALVRDN